MSKDAQSNRTLAEWLAKTFKEVDWLIPAYLSTSFLSQLARALEVAPPEERLQVMRLMLTGVYSPDYLARMFLERYSKIIHIRDFKRHIDESIKAYFSGYKLVAIIALVPVLEGIVRKIATRHNRDIGLGTKNLNVEFQTFVENEMNSLHCYGERVIMLEVLRDFVRDRLLKKTSNYNGLNELNRHGILHGIYGNFGEDINFFRIITLLDLLCFSIGLTEGGVSAFAPEATPESLELAAHYIWLQLVSRTQSCI